MGRTRGSRQSPGASTGAPDRGPGIGILYIPGAPLGTKAAGLDVPGDAPPTHILRISLEELWSGIE